MLNESSFPQLGFVDSSTEAENSKFLECYTELVLTYTTEKIYARTYKY